MAAPCADLRIGGTLSSGGITGGVSINDSRINVTDWSGLNSRTSRDRRLIQVAGRAGGYVAGPGVPGVKIVNLSLTVKRSAETGVLSLAESTRGEQLQANTDLIMQYLADPDGFYLEKDMPDGTSRFIHGYALDGDSVSQTKFRRANILVRCDDPFWRAGGTESTDSLSGSDTFTNGGNVTLYDAVLTFPSTGATLAADDGSWSAAIAATSGAVEVDLGARTITRSGTNVDSLLTLSTGVWPSFPRGDTAVTVTGSAITADWRDPYES